MTEIVYEFFTRWHGDGPYNIVASFTVTCQCARRAGELNGEVGLDLCPFLMTMQIGRFTFTLYASTLSFNFHFNILIIYFDFNVSQSRQASSD